MASLFRLGARDLAIVLAASWLARLLFIAAIGDAHSLDVDYWRSALDALEEVAIPTRPEF